MNVLVILLVGLIYPNGHFQIQFGEQEDFFKQLFRDSESNYVYISVIQL